MFRNVCFTINNPSEEDKTLLATLPTTYSVIGNETGESGTPHLQGYVELQSRMRIQKLKTFLPRAHLQSRKSAKPCDASNYCKKGEQSKAEWKSLGINGPNYGKNADFTESGQISKPGKRNDVASFRDAIRTSASDADLLDEHPEAFFRYPKMVSIVRNAYNRRNNSFKPVQVHVLHGDAGSGKTRLVHDADPDVYTVTDGAQWFDGYIGQKTILIDDFYGGIKYGLFLRLLDGYPFDLPIKGGFTWKMWDTVYITSNDPPDKWYSRGLTPAMARRITSIKKISSEVGSSITPTSGTRAVPLSLTSGTPEPTSGTPAIPQRIRSKIPTSAACPNYLNF